MPGYDVMLRVIHQDDNYNHKVLIIFLIQVHTITIPITKQWYDNIFPNYFFQPMNDKISERSIHLILNSSLIIGVDVNAVIVIIIVIVLCVNVPLG